MFALVRTDAETAEYKRAAPPHAVHAKDRNLADITVNTDLLLPILQGFKMIKVSPEIVPFLDSLILQLLIFEIEAKGRKDS